MAIGPLMIDIQGLIPTSEDQTLLSHPAVGGVILFSKNYQSPTQLTDLVAAIRQLRPTEFLIAVDQEGGQVQRFREGFTILPPASWHGKNYQKQPDTACKISEQTGWLMAAELHSIGIDFSFAPVLDLGIGNSQVIGNRAFADDPETITKLARAWIKGTHSAGMSAVGKHFPGHGTVPTDSHFELPVDNRSLTALFQADLQPFQNVINTGIDAVMASHVLYPKINHQPVTFSSYWLQDILRSQLGFQGVVFSDDLDMKAAANFGNYAARARAALTAGCDMLLICNNRSGALEAANALDSYDHTASQHRLRNMQARMPVLSWDALRMEQRWFDAVAQLSTYTVPKNLDKAGHF